MKKCLVIFVGIALACCSPKEDRKRVSMIEIQIVPSFWFSKRIVVNVGEKYLLYKNLSAFVEEDRLLQNVASENTLIPLTDKEVDSLVMLYDKIIISEKEVEYGPDGETIIIEAVENNELVSIYNGEGIENLRRALIELVRKKSNDPQIKKETSRL